MWKAFIMSLTAGFALLLVSGVVVSRPQQQSAEQKKHQSELDKQQRASEIYQKELPDATLVRLGELTEQQRRHSQLYAHYHRENNSIEWTISKQIADHPGQVVGMYALLGLGPQLTEPEIPENYFGKIASQSDAIIRGRVTKKVSQITEDDGFIFTDYDVVVGEVFKNNASAPINIGATIITTRAGGAVLVGDTIATAGDTLFLPLPTNNDIVMFLQFIPETKAYKTTRYDGCFELNGSVLRPLTGHAFPPGVLHDVNSFLQTVKAIASK